MWHGTWQEANEDGCSRWEVLETRDACHCRSLHSVGPSGGGKRAPGTCPRAWPDHRMVTAVDAQQRSRGTCLWLCPRPQGSYNPLKGQMRPHLYFFTCFGQTAWVEAGEVRGRIHATEGSQGWALTV